MAFVDLPEVAKDTARANVFVSHAWAYRLVDLLAAMEHWAATRNADPAALFLWIDLFSVNQHVSATMTQEWWSTAFVTGIRATGNVSSGLLFFFKENK